MQAKKNRVIASDRMPISDAAADRLVSEFVDYAEGIKDYLRNNKDWKVSYYYVPERSASTHEIRRISFALEYSRKNDNPYGAYDNLILVEFHYDLDENPTMRVTAMCPILKIRNNTYLCGTNDEYPFDSTNIEGLQTIHIGPMMEKIDEMVYDGFDISKWFLS